MVMMVRMRLISRLIWLEWIKFFFMNGEILCRWCWLVFVFFLLRMWICLVVMLLVFSLVLSCFSLLRLLLM